MLSGRNPEPLLKCAAINYMHKAAYLLGDGRWLRHGRRIGGQDTSIFRIGQSFWPDQRLRTAPPSDATLGKWCIYNVPERQWKYRAAGLPLAESFAYGSFRSRLDAGGDYVFVDGLQENGWVVDHSYAINELRLDGYTVLGGGPTYHLNQARVRVDGLVGPTIARDAGLKHKNVIGATATLVVTTPNAPYSSWRRTLAQRVGRYALVVDDFTFRSGGDTIELETLWGGRGYFKIVPAVKAVKAPSGHVLAQGVEVNIKHELTEESARFAILPCDLTQAYRARLVTSMSVFKKARRGERQILFSLLARTPSDGDRSLSCLRLADSAAALRLPQAAVAVVGRYEGIDAELAILAEDHCYAQGLATERVADATLVEADKPVHVDWDFTSGELHVDAFQKTRLSLSVEPDKNMKLDGRAANDAAAVFELSPGRHVFERARPAARVRRAITSSLATFLDKAEAARAANIAAFKARKPAAAPPIREAFTANVGERITNLITIPTEAEALLSASTGKTVHLLSADGQPIRSMNVDAEVRRLRWWKEHGLLLVGCQDYQVMAFDLQGNRQWTFKSEVGPKAELQMGGTRWTEGENAGVQGLHSGVFIDGKSQAFVGTPFQVEIVDESGQLLHRAWMWYNIVGLMQIIDGPNGSLWLLASHLRGEILHALNNRTLEKAPEKGNR